MSVNNPVIKSVNTNVNKKLLTLFYYYKHLKNTLINMLKN